MMQEAAIFIHFYFIHNATKIMDPSNFLKFSTFCMRCSQSANKIAANDGQIKLSIHDI